nr:hypothetical protein [Lichenibacterium ramalinae]
MNSAAPEPDETGEDVTAGAPRISLGKGRALVPVPTPPPTASTFAGLGRSHGLVAAGVAVVMGFGFVAGTEVFASRPRPVAVAKAGPPADTTMDVLVRVQGEVRALKSSLDGLKATAENTRQEDTIRGLKRSVDTLKGDLDGVRSASSAAVGQIGAKLDRLDRDPGPKLAEIAARLDRLDRDPTTKLSDVTARLDRLDPTSKLADVTARLERIERQVASGETTGSLPPQATAAPKPPIPPQRAAPAAVTAVPPVRPEPVRAETPKPDPAKLETAKLEPARSEPARSEPARSEPAKPDAVAKAEPARSEPAKSEPAKSEPAKFAPAKPDVADKGDGPARVATVEGWMLRDVYGGVALLEGRHGGLREVAPGEFVPGVGEIRSIERRGRGWVVVTSRGLIQADARW